MFLTSSLLLLLLDFSSSAVAPPVSKDSDASALVYLLKHGYIEGDDDDGDGDTAQLLSAEGLKGAIRHFQVWGRRKYIYLCGKSDGCSST